MRDYQNCNKLDSSILRLYTTVWN